MKFIISTSIIALFVIGGFGISSYGAPFETNLTVDAPPNLGDVANLTVSFTLSPAHTYPTIENFPVTIDLPDGFELVSGELQSTHVLQRGDTKLEVNTTIKAIQTGNWTIKGEGFAGTSDYLRLVVSEDSSYIHDGKFSKKQFVPKIFEKNQPQKSVNDKQEKSLELLWEEQIGLSETDYLRAVSVNSKNQIIVGGTTYNSLDGQNQGDSDAFLRIYDPDGTLQYAEQFGTETFDEIISVAVSSTDEIIVTGYTDWSYWDKKGKYADSKSDTFLRIYDPDGTLQYVEQFGSRGKDFSADIAVDSKDRIIVGGETTGKIDGHHSNSGNSLFLRIYDLKGNIISYAEQFGQTGINHVGSIAVDSDDRILIVGETQNSINEKDESIYFTFLMIRNSDGTFEHIKEWSMKKEGGSSKLTTVSVDSNDRIIVGGETYAPLHSYQHGNTDAFLRIFNSSVMLEYGDQFGTENKDRVFSISVDSADRVIVGGRIDGIYSENNSARHDAFLRIYDSNNALLQHEQFGTLGRDLIMSTAVDSDDRVIVVGRTDASIKGVHNGTDDAFIRVYGVQTITEKSFFDKFLEFFQLNLLNFNSGE
jgi:hypothetical protein